MKCCHMVSLSCLLLLVGPTAAFASPPAVPWALESRLTCDLPWVQCATFFPQKGAPIAQSYATQPLPGAGRLELPDGETELIRGSARLTLTGPAQYYLREDGALLAPGITGLRYQHPPGTHEDFRVLLPTLIVGTEGTRYSLQVDAKGQVFVQVDDGRIRLQPLLGAQPVTVESGKGATATPDQLLNGEGVSLKTRQELRDAARVQKKALGRGLETVASPSRAWCGEPLSRWLEHSPSLPTARTVFALVQVQGRLCSLAQRVSLVQEAVALYPLDTDAPRLLYQAWLESAEAEQDVLSLSLKQALTRQYSDTVWSVLLSQASTTLLKQPADDTQDGAGRDAGGQP